MNAEVVRLPRLLVASNGHAEWLAPSSSDTGLLLRDTNLASLLHHTGRSYPVAVDLDTVEGLADDDSALHFLIVELGYRILLTHHAGVASRSADMGALALLRVYALDTSGLERSLESHPRRAGVGTVLYPGLVLPHLPEATLESLPKPLVAYGLIETPADLAACLAVADSAVVRPELFGVLAQRQR